MDDLLLSDDLAPLDSSTLNLNPPEEQTQEINHERAMVQAGSLMIEEILSWFDADLKALDSISGLDAESPVELKAQLLGRGIAKTMLEASRERLAGLQEQYVTQA